MIAKNDILTIQNKRKIGYKRTKTQKNKNKNKSSNKTLMIAATVIKTTIKGKGIVIYKGEKTPIS